jgi:hypothetical protein
VTATVGGVLPPLLQTVPLSVNCVGGLLAPLNVPLKATLKVVSVASVAFHAALLETVTVGLPAGWENVTGQPFCTRWPFGKLNTSDQPVIVGPVFLMSILAPKPFPPTQVGAV